MAALWITLDYLDGRSLIKGPVYPDEVDLTGLLFRLNERGSEGRVEEARTAPLAEHERVPP